ncbi:MAG: hypothetical protein IBJ10_11315 [Phycisphaerales bacterium]|nr:hypothetical protein [Phycisphaerales bacterium]
MNHVIARSLAAAAALAAAGSAHAIGLGDIVFVDVTGDTVNSYRYGPAARFIEHTFADASNEINLAQIRRVNGSWYVNSDNVPIQNPSVAQIFRIDNLFGASSHSTVFASHPLQRPIGLDYHRGSDTLIAINNAPQADQLPVEFEGILGVARDGSSAGFIFDEDVGNPTNPRYKAGNRITKDPYDADRFYVTATNGGAGDTGVGPDTVRPSQIYTLDMANDGSGTLTQLVDFTSTATTLTFVRGITSAIGQDGFVDLYITDSFADAIYRVDLDANGDFAALSLVANVEDPGEIQYNKYTNTLVFGQIALDTLSQINLDGTGYQVLATNVSPRGIWIVPTPGAGALIAVAGLVGLRRRR